jgi:hypothetical protein
MIACTRAVSMFRDCPVPCSAGSAIPCRGASSTISSVPRLSGPFHGTTLALIQDTAYIFGRFTQVLQGRSESEQFSFAAEPSAQVSDAEIEFSFRRCVNTVLTSIFQRTGTQTPTVSLAAFLRLLLRSNVRSSIMNFYSCTQARLSWSIAIS